MGRRGFLGGWDLMWAWKVGGNWLGTELRVLHRDGVYEQKCEAGKVADVWGG